MSKHRKTRWTSVDWFFFIMLCLVVGVFVLWFGSALLQAGF